MKNPELWRRVRYSLLIIIIMELGRQVVLPLGTSTELSAINQHQLSGWFLNYLTGGEFQRPVLFSLGIGPYITSMIFWSIIAFLGADTVRKMTQKRQSSIQKSLALLFAILQAYQYANSVGLQGLNRPWQLFQIIILLVGGAMFVAWLVDQNTVHGLGGAAMILLPTLIQGLPSMLFQGPAGRVSFHQGPLFWMMLCVVTLIFVQITVFLNQAEYRVPIQRPILLGGYNQTYLPIRFLPSGAMPMMFAVSIFILPQYLVAGLLPDSPQIQVLMATFFNPSTWQGMLVYVILLSALGYVFGFVSFQPAELAKQMQENDDYLLHILPGPSTERFLTQKLRHFIAWSNAYFVFISLIALVIGHYFEPWANLAFYLGSIVVLVTIIVGVLEEIRALTEKYAYVMKDW